MGSAMFLSACEQMSNILALVSDMSSPSTRGDSHSTTLPEHRNKHSESDSQVSEEPEKKPWDKADEPPAELRLTYGEVLAAGRQREQQATVQADLVQGMLPLRVFIALRRCQDPAAREHIVELLRSSFREE